MILRLFVQSIRNKGTKIPLFRGLTDFEVTYIIKSRGQENEKGVDKMKKEKKPMIMNVVRNEWSMNPVTRIKESKKGKGSYKRQKFKKAIDGMKGA